ncbi:MAG: toprim domain-containing protein [Candidatus Hodarchaeales archaeon]|jgi:DNA primase
MSNKIYKSVAEFCHGRLFRDDSAISYLTNRRKLSEQTIKEFEIGLFPQDLRELFEIEKPQDLRENNIIYNASVSQFKTRNLILPIKDAYNNYIGMAGRTLLPEKEREERRIAKYINIGYKKNNHLFGLNFAKHNILKKGVVYVAEGYFDVIKSRQEGLVNVIAVCGTHLSNRHIALLSRYADEIILVFDNEENAQKRAKNIVDKKQHKKVELRATNPLKDAEEKDIDEYLRKGHSIKDLLSALNEENYDDLRTLW